MAFCFNNEGVVASNKKRSYANLVSINDLSNNSIEPWFVVRTKFKKETQLIYQFKLIGYEAWMPVVNKYRIRRGKKEKLNVPLISGYVFVHKEETLLPKKFNIPGSRGLLMYNGNPAIISHQEILRLQQVSKNDPPPEVISDFKKGQHITIKSGILKDVSGNILHIEGTRYLIIESGISGIYLKVNIESHIIDIDKTE